ncbi:hypothetical protein TIFTF001_003779 [Ficus carica]|uniref:Uncharacterized protein n=1 Tax=Ficus carica TaxID=3494 RepID=A0AA88A1J6_FICCA|nr:hypothetical protein TIFTF001_003779 [Ficus carica]
MIEFLDCGQDSGSGSGFETEVRIKFKIQDSRLWLGFRKREGTVIGFWNGDWGQDLGQGMEFQTAVKVKIRD